MSYMDMIKAAAGEPKQPALTVVTNDDAKPRAKNEGIHPYAEAIRQSWLDRLDNLPRPWVSGSSYWDSESFNTARKLVELANSAWSGYSILDARADFMAHAPYDHAWDKREDKWERGSEKAGNTGLPEPAPGETYKPPPATVLDDGDPVQQSTEIDARRVRVKSLATITMRATQWVWVGRIALGTLALLAGREGAGKSTLAYQIAADLTNGVLEGDMKGTPQSVIVCATEDSMSQTIVPRLVAAGADLNRVLQVDIETEAGVEGLRLPVDIGAVERIAKENNVGLMILDPLISRLGDLDTHRDAEVRQALEPLVGMAERAAFAIIGLIHHNKSSTTDPLGMVMGSRAFTAVARSVHTVMIDPEDDAQRVFGTVKNNLGSMDLPSLVFGIESKTVGHDVDLDMPITSGRIKWVGEREASIASLLEDTSGGEDADDRYEIDGWLRHYLTERGNAQRADILKAAYAQGFSKDQLDRARKRIGVKFTKSGFQGTTAWELGD